MIHRWKDIPGYDGKCQADTEGNGPRKAGESTMKHFWQGQEGDWDDRQM